MLVCIYIYSLCKHMSMHYHTFSRSVSDDIDRAFSSINVYLHILLYTLHNQQIEHIVPPFENFNYVSR